MDKNSASRSSNEQGSRSTVTQGLDAYRRNADEAARDEDTKATKRYINAMILAHEAEAVGVTMHGPNDVLGAEIASFNRGIAEGLRMALRSFRQDEGSSLGKASY